jgi:hypothetical protein
VCISAGSSGALLSIRSWLPSMWLGYLLITVPRLWDWRGLQCCDRLILSTFFKETIPRPTNFLFHGHTEKTWWRGRRIPIISDPEGCRRGVKKCTRLQKQAFLFSAARPPSSSTPFEESTAYSSLHGLSWKTSLIHGPEDTQRRKVAHCARPRNMKNCNSNYQLARGYTAAVEVRVMCSQNTVIQRHEVSLK